MVGDQPGSRGIAVLLSILNVSLAFAAAVA